LNNNSDCIPETTQTTTMRTTCGPDPIRTTVYTWYGNRYGKIFNPNDHPAFKCYYDPSTEGYYRGNQPIGLASLVLYVAATVVSTFVLVFAIVIWLYGMCTMREFYFE
jgi:hypothetical protein